MAASCTEQWLEWGLDCELQRDHTGAHLHYSGVGGRVGAWGAGGPSSWRRATA